MRYKAGFSFGTKRGTVVDRDGTFIGEDFLDEGFPMQPNGTITTHNNIYRMNDNCFGHNNYLGGDVCTNDVTVAEP